MTRTTPLMRRIQERYGKPWHDVVDKLRQEGLTWEQVAEEIGISYTTLCNWRSDKRTMRSRKERVAIVRDVIRIVESERTSIERACRQVAEQRGMRWLQVRGLYYYAVDQGECKRVIPHYCRPLTLSEVERIGTLMQTWRKRGRTVKEALQLTANELGRSAATVYQYWYEGLRSGQWTDPGKRRHRQSLASVVGGIGS